jgi:hypothetical protein
MMPLHTQRRFDHFRLTEYICMLYKTVICVLCLKTIVFLNVNNLRLPFQLQCEIHT